MDMRRGTFVFSLLCALLLSACAPRSGEMIVAQIGPSKVSLKEYESFYARNSGGWEVGRQSSQEDRERFLDLLTNYKLKLQDAYDRKLLNDSDIVSELSDYRSNLASTFLLEKEVTDPGLQKVYNRKKEEIRAHQILLSVKAGTSPEETLKIWNQATDLIRRAKAGESFDSLVLQYSEDPTAKANRGDIYYFTSGQMTPIFEDAAYGMKTGEIRSEERRVGKECRL